MPALERGVLPTNYRIFETAQFQKDLRYLGRAGHTSLARRIESVVYQQIREHPHYGPNIKKLKGYEPETWRYLIGAWRFFYEIDDGERVVFMVAASHRGSAY